jgi:hypothetical protein
MLGSPLPRPFSISPSLPRNSVLSRLPAFVWDFGVVLAVMGLYFLARGQAPSRIDAAVGLSLRLVNAERSLHIFREPALQQASIHLHWARELANVTYAYLHFPVMAVVGVWLWWRGRDRFIFMRNVMFVSMAIGIVFYYLLPAAPPRLLALNGHDLGFADTVFGGATAVKYAQPSLILNEYAAIPSYHFGWILMSAAAVWANTSNRVLRGLSAGMVVLMTWAIVASANHFFIDMVLGGIVIGISWSIARRLARSEEPVELVFAPVPVTTDPGNRHAA